MKARFATVAILASAILMTAGCGTEPEAGAPASSGAAGAPASSGAAGAPTAARPEGRNVRQPAEGGVLLPKLELPESSNAAADMIGLFVYQGRIYTQTDTSIDPQSAKALLGEKIGRTIGTIDEWSSQDEFSAEFASSIGAADIYAVHGYDPGFRLMAFEERDGEVWAELYECLNGFTVTRGSDLFGSLKLEGSVASARWERRDSWDYGKDEFQPLNDDGPLDAFVAALNEAKPVDHDKLYKQGIYESPDQRFLLLALEDHTVVRLRLFRDGYVKYGNARVFFQIGDNAFKKMWDALA
ncbi:hypothetical protein SAMN02799624_06000 [Paenibacillus sp. UNC496MF]|uniref:hypothetical protein n=1 Tax=Paenibacillus sp. UNC496MF TaxID=1502753 RepID=UPI0008E6A4F9|nr:hypothetical protein [Paenibacillus sp. UNC496MF]SFJ79714.1 hypothetical protein SAMN02799624_06000 [Paenibacillus sp. UNC496MF]